MPRHMQPQVGTQVWFFADPTRRPQTAIVTKRITKNSLICRCSNRGWDTDWSNDYSVLRGWSETGVRCLLHANTHPG